MELKNGGKMPGTNSLTSSYSNHAKESSIDCYGVSARGGVGFGAKADIGICFEDDFPFFYPRVSVGLGAAVIGAAVSYFEEITSYENAYSYAAETVDSWFRLNLPKGYGIALFGVMESHGKSDTDYEKNNVRRDDHTLGLIGQLPMFSEEGNSGPAAYFSVDVVGLIWNGVLDAAESSWHLLSSASAYIWNGVTYTAEYAWNGISSAAEGAWESVCDLF